MINFTGKQFPKGIILMTVRWYVAYPLSDRNIEELMAERNISVDHATINRWVIEYSPQLEKEFRKKYKNAVNSSWRMDETYLKVKGNDVYLYRAVDKLGKTIDFMLSEKRDKEIELHHMLKKGQHKLANSQTLFQQFYELAV